MVLLLWGEWVAFADVTAYSLEAPWGLRASIPGTVSISILWHDTITKTTELERWIDWAQHAGKALGAMCDGSSNQA